MFSNTEVIVAPNIMSQYLVASLSLLVICQRPIYRSLSIYKNSWLSFRSKSVLKISSARRFLRLHKMMAPALNVDFIHAILEEISYLVF